jgi:hypothetical protein
MTTKSAQDFARDLTAIVDASANALATLNRVLEQQQQSILRLASEGGVPASSTAGLTSGSRPAASQASAATPATGDAPSVDDSHSHGTPLPTTASPEDILAHAEKTARALIEHAPEISLAQIYQASAHAIGLAFMNTVSAQQQLNIVAQAVVTKGAANQLSGSRTAALPSTEKAAPPELPAAPRAQVPKARAR